MKNRSPTPSFPARALGASACLAAVVGLFLVLGNLRAPADTFFWRELWNLGHAPLFAGVALALYGLVRITARSCLTRTRELLVALILSIVAGGIGEVVQVYFARDPDPWDYLRNLAGALVALLWTASLLGGHSEDGKLFRAGARLGLRLAAIVVLLAVSVPFLVWCEAYRQRSARFPVVYACDSRLETFFYETRAVQFDLVPPPDGWLPRSRTRVVRLDYERARYPNLTFFEPVSDWTGHEFLEIDLYLRSPESVDVAFFVADRQYAEDHDDLFRRVIRLRPGPNPQRIPMTEVGVGYRGRELDLTAVDQVALLGATWPPVPFTVYLAGIRLSGN